MMQEVYGWVIYVNGTNDDFICAWAADEKDLVVHKGTGHWIKIIPAKEALESLHYENPTMANLIECLF